MKYKPGDILIWMREPKTVFKIIAIIRQKEYQIEYLIGQGIYVHQQWNVESNCRYLSEVELLIYT